MRVLIGCEASGVVREAFRSLGHNAWSCDLRPSEDGSEYHVQGDVVDVIRLGWDLAIFHPSCTYLTGSAAWAYGDGPYHQAVKPGTLTGAARREAREQAIEFVKRLWDCGIERVAIENPVGVLSTRWRKPTQYIHPYQFGDDASKKTGLWLRGLSPLIPTQVVEGRDVVIHGRIVKRWANQTDSGQNRLSPSDDRWIERSRTYQGIANAMAAQWGGGV